MRAQYESLTIDSFDQPLFNVNDFCKLLKHCCVIPYNSAKGQLSNNHNIYHHRESGPSNYHVIIMISVDLVSEIVLVSISLQTKHTKM